MSLTTSAINDIITILNSFQQPILIAVLILFVIISVICRITPISDILKHVFIRIDNKDKKNQKSSKKIFEQLQSKLYQEIKSVKPYSLTLKDVTNLYNKLNKIINSNATYNHPSLDTLMDNLSYALDNKKLLTCQNIISTIKAQIKDEYFRLRKVLGYPTSTFNHNYKYFVPGIIKDILHLLVLSSVTLLFLFFFSRELTLGKSPDDVLLQFYAYFSMLFLSITFIKTPIFLISWIIYGVVQLSRLHKNKNNSKPKTKNNIHKESHNMYTTEKISPTELHLDEQNPRFRIKINPSQNTSKMDH